MAARATTSSTDWKTRIIWKAAREEEYHVVSDGKADTIRDVDGRGVIELDGEILRGGEGVLPNIWKSADGAIAYRLDGATLEVVKDGDVQVRVLDFKSGDLGI
ncbi:MAG: hypothetical protein LBF93_00540, partial [Zoogloeaceae bacterium]|nr:hypothetical protein [Zoogloeaceae bacterium]